MKFKLNYLIIPLMVFAVASLGSLFTSSGMDWYKTINLPDFTPSGSFIGFVWTVIFILATISLLIVWNKYLAKSREQKQEEKTNRSGCFLCDILGAVMGKRGWIISLFVINGFLNLTWSFLFFNRQLIGSALVDAGALAISVLFLIILIWPLSRLSSILLLPYFLWVSFATYLNFIIWQLN